MTSINKSIEYTAEFDRLKLKILKKLEKKVFSPVQKEKAEIFSLKFSLETINPLLWLQVQSIHPKIYWCDRKQDFEMAGIGQADLIKSQTGSDLPKVFKTINSNLSFDRKSIRYFGGLSFDLHGKKEHCWDSFGNYYFVLPRFELIRQRDKTSLVINFRFSGQQDFEAQRQALPAELDQIVFKYNEKKEKIPRLLGCEYNPGRNKWTNNVDTVLNEIENGAFEKIVLARQTRLDFAADLNPFVLMQRLQQIDPDNIYFYLQPVADICFMCGTPESLYSRQGRKINVDAVAATRLRGKNETEDERLEQDLLNSPKDIKEHWYVLKCLQENLNKLCQRFSQQGKTTVLKQARIQHLYASLAGVLKQNITDDEIIANLHPTPAVGGFPTGAALGRLKSLESFNRGWYAAPVGWISNQSAKFVVAIRSGLICENRLVLFSGAGIVKGSQAEAEWNETNNKIASYLKVLRIREDSNS